jgi:dihydroxyacetone kinase
MAASFLLESESPIREALRGLALTSAGEIAVSLNPLFVSAARCAPERIVALVSGGGAGHEPMHAGFVGVGGLDAACPGEIFTSPHNRQIFDASRRVAKPGGVLHIVKNYTGDRINFAIAAERLRAEGIDVATVLVDDDLGSEGNDVGRRGTGATVIVEKILGAAADAGLPLEELAALGESIVANSRTLAVAHAAHTNPTTGESAFEVEPGNLEYGVGIHGETAAQSIVQPPLVELVQRMVDELVAAVPSDRYLLFVNGLGAATALELQQITAQATRALGGREVVSAVSGTYISALDMRGFSLTLTVADDAWLPFWFADHETALPRPLPASALILDDAQADEREGDAVPDGFLRRLDETFASRRAALNELDQRAGDGDMGSNLASGTATAVREYRASDGSLGSDLRAIARAFLDAVGGSSGPLFGLLFQELSTVDATADGIAQGLAAGLAAVQRVGDARPGDRTLVDALHPATGRPFDAAAVRAAIEGARETSGIVARRGRASYVGARAVGHPDPGAVAVALMLVALLEHLEPSAVDGLWAEADALLTR